MASPASIGGHPVHPMLIPFPIGLWVFSLIADLIYLWRGNPVWWNYIAFYTLLGGTISAAIAAVPGLIDWLSLKDPQVVKVANWQENYWSAVHRTGFDVSDIQESSLDLFHWPK